MRLHWLYISVVLVIVDIYYVIEMRYKQFHQSFIQLIASASTAGGLRTCDSAAFASLKKYATHFSNPYFVGIDLMATPYQT